MLFQGCFVTIQRQANASKQFKQKHVALPIYLSALTGIHQGRLHDLLPKRIIRICLIEGDK